MERLEGQLQSQHAHLVFQSLEIIEDAVAEAVVHGLRDESGGQVSCPHPGQTPPQGTRIVGWHGPEKIQLLDQINKNFELKQSEKTGKHICSNQKIRIQKNAG